MTDGDDGGNGAAMRPQLGQNKAKSAARVENMRRINREGRAGPGGRRIDHGLFALEQRFEEGLDPDSAMARYHAERRNAYAGALGGLQGLDEFQRGSL